MKGEENFKISQTIAERDSSIISFWFTRYKGDWFCAFARSLLPLFHEKKNREKKRQKNGDSEFVEGDSGQKKNI